MTLDEINAKYNDDTYEVFPFIAKNKITILRHGLYRKDKAKFRGVTAVYNEEFNQYEYPLYGMYSIDEDLVIVPDELELSPGRQTFLEATLQAGYTRVNRAPKFKTIMFPADSEEAKLALANKLNYQINLKEQ